MSSLATVLVVDDHPKNVKLLSAHLSHAGYSVLQAFNGQEAISVASQDKPDLILLDIMMPGLNGYQVAEHLKDTPQTKTIPIILVTALGDVADKVRGLEAGADDFLSKPVNSSDLLARVKSLVSLKKLQEYQRLQLAQCSQPHRPGRKDDEFILVVEDDPVAARVYEALLGKAGHTVVTAHRAGDALDIIAKKIPALIILDMMLPGMSGLELLYHIKADKACLFTSVIIVSGLDDLETKVKGIDAGADDYILKPVNPLEFKARVRANLRKHSVQHKMQHDLHNAFQQATTDALTTLYNRFYFDDTLRKLLAESRRSKGIFSLLMLDIDHFKTVNDTFGHVAGDHVLQELARLINNLIRESDIACRYGGEEFAVLLPGTLIGEAAILAERMRAAIEKHAFPDINGQQLTISIGIAESGIADRDDPMIVRRADEALYLAKQQGRNQVRKSY